MGGAGLSVVCRICASTSRQQSRCTPTSLKELYRDAALLRCPPRHACHAAPYRVPLPVARPTQRLVIGARPAEVRTPHHCRPLSPPRPQCWDVIGHRCTARYHNNYQGHVHFSTEAVATSASVRPGAGQRWRDGSLVESTTPAPWKLVKVKLCSCCLTIMVLTCAVRH